MRGNTVRQHDSRIPDLRPQHSYPVSEDLHLPDFQSYVSCHSVLKDNESAERDKAHALVKLVTEVLVSIRDPLNNVSQHRP